MSPLDRSRALWNRAGLDLRSDEVLAQLLDRGELDAWRELYARAAGDAALQARIHRLVLRGAVGFPHFWLAALASLGRAIDWSAPPAPYGEIA
jgi:hypothetical protein